MPNPTGGFFMMFGEEQRQNLQEQARKAEEAEKQAKRIERLGKRAASKRSIKAPDGALARIQVDVNIARMVGARVNAFEVYMANLQHVPNGPLQIAGRHAAEMIRRRMVRGKTPDGSDFAPLSPAYAKNKASAMRTGYNNAQQPPVRTAMPPKSNLYYSGELYRSVRSWVGGKNSQNPTVTVGVTHNKGLAALLHSGDGGKMPARPFLTLNGRERAILSREFDRNMKIGVGKAILAAR